MIAKRILPTHAHGQQPQPALQKRTARTCTSRYRRVGLAALATLAICFCLAVLPAKAQDSKLDEPPPPPPEESSAPPPASAPAAPAAPASPAPKPAPVDPRSSGPAKPDEPPAPAVPEPPAQPVLDPVGAKRSLDVGTFYLKKGDYDAAIDRFKEAADRQPKLAKPYLLLGEAYEKKNDPASAITAYRKYLQLYRDAPDEDKVSKRIEKLTALESKRDPLQH